ncbi:cytochrome P450 3A56-like [Stegodyphus dumicola]|uniref:cytochrome P450 3A56-like n=1 Tax=Stegodyphus dumicola TaxID=202533 RepID=UPI0015B0642F|nr:cytochrome P450 3A56-like [Stegodyphus dumicola]
MFFKIHVLSIKLLQVWFHFTFRMWAFTFFVVAVVLWLFWRKRKFSIFKKLGIPGPEPNLLFGNLLELYSKDPLKCQKEWIQKYGKVVGYYYGTEPIVLITDVELLKKIQISYFHKFINRPHPRCLSCGSSCDGATVTDDNCREDDNAVRLIIAIGTAVLFLQCNCNCN